MKSCEGASYAIGSDFEVCDVAHVFVHSSCALVDELNHPIATSKVVVPLVYILIAEVPASAKAAMVG